MKSDTSPPDTSACVSKNADKHNCVFQPKNVNSDPVKSSSVQAVFRFPQLFMAVLRAVFSPGQDPSSHVLQGVIGSLQSEAVPRLIPPPHPMTITFLSFFFLNTVPHSEFMFPLCIVVLYPLSFYKLEVRSREVWLRHRLNILSKSSFIDDSAQESWKVSFHHDERFRLCLSCPAPGIGHFPQGLLLERNDRVHSLGLLETL